MSLISFKAYRVLLTVVQVNFLSWTLQIDTAVNRGFEEPIPKCTTVHAS